MRTKKEITKFLNSLKPDLKDYYEREGDHDFIWALWESAHSLKLMNFGLLGGYGSSISYKEHRITIVGCSESNREFFVNKFLKNIFKTPLSELYINMLLNQSLLFDSENNNQLHIYNPILPKANSWKEAINNLSYHLMIEENKGSELELILNLRYKYNKESGFIDTPDINNAVSYLCAGKKDETKMYRQKILKNPRLKKIKFLEYNTFNKEYEDLTIKIGNIQHRRKGIVPEKEQQRFNKEEKRIYTKQYEEVKTKLDEILN